MRTSCTCTQRRPAPVILSINNFTTSYSCIRLSAHLQFQLQLLLQHQVQLLPHTLFAVPPSAVSGTASAQIICAVQFNSSSSSLQLTISVASACHRAIQAPVSVNSSSVAAARREIRFLTPDAPTLELLK